MKSKPFGALFGLLALVAILGVAPAFGQTANEIDIATGAGGSANAACVATNNCFTPNPLTVGVYSGGKQPVSQQYYIATVRVLADTASAINPRGLGITS